MTPKKPGKKPGAAGKAAGARGLGAPWGAEEARKSDVGATSAAQSSGDTGDTPADTLDTPPETPETSPENGQNAADSPGDTGDTPGDRRPAGDELTGAAGAAPGAHSSAAEIRAVKPPVGGRTQREYDWPAIKARYVEGVRNPDEGITEWHSLDQVAAHFQVVPARVREKSAMEGWVEERNRYQAQVEATRRHARAAAMSKKATELDGSALNAAGMGLQLCIARLAELGQRAQAMRAQTVGDGTPQSGIDALEMQRLAAAVELWHKVGLRAVGDPETHRIELTGSNGQPLEIAQELKRDDPSRLAGVLAVLRQAGLGDLFGAGDVARLLPGGPVAREPATDGPDATVEARR